MALAACLIPGVAIDLLAEAAAVVVASVVEVELGPLTFLAIEAMGGGAEPDGGASTLEVSDKGVGLIIGELHEAGVKEEEVGFLEDVDVRDGGAAAFDVSAFVHSEKDGAFEAVMLGEDLGDERAGFLRTVFVIVGNEDDVFAFARAFSAFVDERRGGEEAGGGHECEK